jgi:hypothetical protein
MRMSKPPVLLGPLASQPDISGVRTDLVEEDGDSSVLLRRIITAAVVCLRDLAPSDKHESNMRLFTVRFSRLVDVDHLYKTHQNRSRGGAQRTRGAVFCSSPAFDYGKLAGQQVAKCTPTRCFGSSTIVEVCVLNLEMKTRTRSDTVGVRAAVRISRRNRVQRVPH